MTEQRYYKRGANVQARYLIRGRLVLTSPTSLSNGDSEGLTDADIRRDEVSGRPLLPGTSLAGALRSYLWQRLGKGGRGELNRVLVDQLFGENDAEKGESRQSWLFVEDSLGQEAGIEIRDGVAIDDATRTASEHKKFDMELLAAGSAFNLRFEFWEPADASLRPQAMRQLLALALMGLGQGEVPLGGRKRRGFGECQVDAWRVVRYDMSTKEGILGWLESDESELQPGDTLADALGLQELPELPAQDICQLKATFDLATSLLVRAAPADPAGADQVHLRNASGAPVLPGTSVAGALRARARRILMLVNPDEADALINDLFGQEMDEENASPRASRLWIREAQIRQRAREGLVQSRVKIDRFTAGSYPGALFDQQPLWEGTVTLEMTVQGPRTVDVGLLLLLLKDLWTGDLPLGGEASVGRGRLQGRQATITWREREWRIRQSEDGLRIDGDIAPLDAAVADLQNGGAA